MGRPKGSKNKPKEADGGGETRARVGSNGFDPQKVQGFVARIESLHADIASIMGKAMSDCKSVHEDIKIVYDEAKDEAGIPKKALKSVIKARDLERKADEVREDLEPDTQETYDQIRFALGDLADTPLGQAALDFAEGDDLRPRFKRNDPGEEIGTEKPTFSEA